MRIFSSLKSFALRIPTKSALQLSPGWISYVSNLLATLSGFSPSDSSLFGGVVSRLVHKSLFYPHTPKLQFYLYYCNCMKLRCFVGNEFWIPSCRAKNTSSLNPGARTGNGTDLILLSRRTKSEQINLGNCREGKIIFPLTFWVLVWDRCDKRPKLGLLTGLRLVYMRDTQGKMSGSLRRPVPPASIPSLANKQGSLGGRGGQSQGGC